MDDLQVRELLADAARTTPAERNPVRAVLGRRRRARLRAAGWSAGALLVLGVAAVTVDPSGLRDTPAPVSTAVPATVEATIDDVVDDALPGFPGVEVGESRWARLPGENIHNGYSGSATDTRTHPGVWLSITVQHYEDVPYVPIDGEGTTSGGPGSPTVSGWQDETTVEVGDAQFPFLTPRARAVYEDGRVVDVTATPTGTDLGPLQPGDTFPRATGITPQALAQIAGDPRLADIPLPELP